MLKLVAVVAGLTVVCPFVLSAETASPAAAPRVTARVRPHDGRSATLLLRGIERSTTLRLIVEQLESRDVIVYIEMQPLLRSHLAGRMTWLSATKSFRYVRLSLNPDLSQETLVGVLGHELQHALEVAQAPTIVDEASLENYYREHGFNVRSHTSGWDTLAARDAGELVRKELAGSPASRAVESVAPFDPATWHILYRQVRDRYMMP